MIEDPIGKLPDILQKAMQSDVTRLKTLSKDFDFHDISDPIIKMQSSLLFLSNDTNVFDQFCFVRKKDIVSKVESYANILSSLTSPEPIRNDIQRKQKIREFLDLDKLHSELYYELVIPLNLYRYAVPERLDEVIRKADASSKAIKRAEDQSLAIIRSLQQSTSQESVCQFAALFANEADSHQKASHFWLFVTVVFGIGIIFFLSDMLHSIEKSLPLKDINNGFAFQIFLSKVLIFSFLSVVFYHILRNYSVNKHLRTLNQHKANALRTFTTFVESTVDQKIKDAVLLQATKAIFEAGETGYIAHSDTTATSLDTVKIVEQLNSK